MKNILFIIHSLTSGGAEKVLIDTLNEFDYRKYNVSLLLLRKEGRYIDNVPKNVKIKFLHNQTILCRILNRIYKSINLYEKITRAKIVKSINKNYDTIISFCHGDSLKYHSEVFHKATKNISWIHCDMWNRNKDEVIDLEKERNYYNSLDKIVFVSNDAQKKFNKLYCDNINKKQIVIYNFITFDTVLEKSKKIKLEKKNKFTISTVGRLYDEKAYDRLIRVASMLKQCNFDFVIWIVGEGILEKKLKKLSDKLKVSDKIIFWGFKDNPYPFIKNSDVFISTSKTEALPLVVCEALCLGKPIIATKTSGPTELLSGDFGLLTDHDDKSIYNAIKSIMINCNLIEYYQKRSIEKSKIFTNECIKLIYEIL